MRNTVEKTCPIKVTYKSDVTKKCLELLTQLKAPVPATWLLKPENTILFGPDTLLKYALEDILLSAEFSESNDRADFICDILRLSSKKVVDIARGTVGQYSNRTYCKLKKFRLTGSNFGIVLRAVQRKSYPPSLYKRLLGAYNLEKVVLQLPFDTCVQNVNQTEQHFLLTTIRYKQYSGVCCTKIRPWKC
jgi:hypothetical protein